MDLERDYLPFTALGIICLLCATATTIGGSEKVGLWMVAMNPIFVLLSIACLSVSWIRWSKATEKD